MLHKNQEIVTVGLPSIHTHRLNRHIASVKFASFDGQVAIMGNGNQGVYFRISQVVGSSGDIVDTQSWYHSQEINVMVDSTEVVADWRAAIENNQNTAVHGMIDASDGLYHDKQGNVVESSAGRGQCRILTSAVSELDLTHHHTGGALAWVKGIGGTIQRVRGVGGF